MSFNTDPSSSLKARKLESDFTVQQLRLKLKTKHSKPLTRDDPFIIAVTIIEHTREYRKRSVDRSMTVLLKHVNVAYNSILSVVKCRMIVRNGKENEKE